MKINGMEEFQTVCREKLIHTYFAMYDKEIALENTFVVWSCKTLQNYKVLLSTNVLGDGCYVEYTFNGDKGELYEDFYKKISNICYVK